MDLDSFLISLYVLVDDWWQESRSTLRRPGRPALLSDPEVLTLAILAQWPRFRSERDFWRFASSHLRCYFPNLCTQGQLNRRIRALEPELRALQGALAGELSEPSAVYRVLDTTLVPAIVRVRASRKGLFCGQATFGRSASKTEWIYGFKVALVVDPDGVITAFGLAPAASDERPIGEALIAEDLHEAYLADKGFSRGCSGSGAGWRSSGLWWPPPPTRTLAGHGRSPIAVGLASLGKRQIVEGVICQLSRTSSLWSVAERRPSPGCWHVWPPRSRPTPALNA
jgi:hypothetical protein